MLSSRSVLVALLVTAATTALIAQKPMREPRAGIVFSPPSGWAELPADVDRAATVRLFAAPAAFAGKGEDKHTPLLRVMFFGKVGNADRDVVDGLPRTTPFRSLEDFATRGLGSKSVAKEAQKLGAVAGHRVVGKDVPGSRVLIGRTIETTDGEAAVCVDVLAAHADKLQKEIDLTFASMEPLPRVPSAKPTPPWIADPEWAKKDAAARAAAHRKWAETIVAATAANPEYGYKVSKAKSWTVLSSADPAFTRRVIAAAETAREWLAKKLPELTQDAPMPAVLRVFDSVAQFNGYLTTRNDTREYDQLRRELLVVNDRDNGGATGWGPTARAVLWHLLDDVDPGVLPALPRWLDHGCWEFLRSSKLDGKKLEFAPSDVEKGRIDYYRQKNQPLPNLWDLMQEKAQPSPTDGSMEQDWGYTPECARLLRWLWMHDGQKAFDKPSLVADYVKALAAAHAKVGVDPTADVPVLGLTEAQQKERNGRYYKWRDALLVATNDIGVPMQVDAWKAVNGRWLEFNKTFK